MNYIKLFYFYTTWSFFLHILGLVYNFNTYELAVFVFIGSIFLNVHYLRIYNIKQNLFRLPVEIIFHIAPLYFVNKNPNTIIKSRIIILFMTLLYVYTFSCDEIFKLYNDPLRFIELCL